MDFHVRFWEEGLVKTRYLTSEFLGHAGGFDLFEKIQNVQTEFKLRKQEMLQLGMDGPNVNWNVYNRVHSNLKENEHVGLIHTGSCGLHTVHNAFRAGCDATKWQIDSFLSAAYYLFKDSPARREDYISVAKGDAMPSKFSSTRWLENASVATKCIELLPSLESFVKAAIDKKITMPDCKSFETVKANVVNAPLVPCKLAFFGTVAREMEPFLKKYQRDEPLIPYLSSDLQKMLKSLMRRFLRQSLFKDCDTAERLTAIDILDKENYCQLSDIDVGFQTRSLLQKAKTSKKNAASDQAIMQFQIECRKFLIATVGKLLDKCPLKYSVVREISCLNPQTIINKESCKQHMKNLLHTLCGVKRLQHTTADIILNEFQEFLENIKCEITSFDSSAQRLDTWFHSAIASDPKCQNLWNIVQKLLVLSHGQASVERGFSYNKEVLSDNLSQKALKARRMVLDHIQTAGGILKVNLNKKLLLDAGRARTEYVRFLEEQQRLRESDEKTERKKKKTEEIEVMKKKKKVAEDNARQLLSEADELAFKAQELRSFTLIDRSNQLRLLSKDKQEEAGRLEKELNKLQEELKSMTS